MPRLLLLMPTKSYRASAFIAAAAKLQFDLVVATEQPQSLSAFAPHQNLTLPFLEPPRAVQAIVDFAAGRPLDAIVPVDENTAVIAAMANIQLDLPGNSVASAQAAMFKHQMRKVLAGSGLPTPWYRVVSLEENLELVSGRLHYPCVIKPLFLSGSRGVIRVDNRAAFSQAVGVVQHVLEDPDVAGIAPDLATRLLIEEYIPGDEVALEGILTAGELKVFTIFDKPDPLDGPYFEETIYVTPSRKGAQVQDQLAAVVQRASSKMGIRHGPVHAELRINDRGIWVVEIAARSIGGLCSKALRFRNTTSLEEILLRHAAGENIHPVERESLASGVMMIPIPKAGLLVGYSGLSEATAVSGVEEIKIAIPLTQRVVPIPQGNRYLGFIFARGETPQDVETALRRANAFLSFEIE